jgi:alpha-tubulin suppressor-like RCC1 family protein
LHSPKTGSVKVDGIHTAVGVAAGYEHSAALLANGTVMSWGANVFGQLAIGTRNVQQSLDPIAVESVHTATSISAGDLQTQVLLKDGTVMGWGDDDAGQLGDGTTNPEVVSPVSVTGLQGRRASAWEAPMRSPSSAAHRVW